MSDTDPNGQTRFEWAPQGGGATTLPTTPAELESALRELRQSRSDGSWPGGVSVLRDGRPARIGGADL